ECAGRPLVAGRRTGRPIWRRTMRTPVRRTVIAAVVMASALALITAGGVLGRTPATVAADSTVERPATAESRLDQSISQARDRLRRLPGDWQPWAALGMASLEKARITADPSWYPKADDAVAHSLSVRPHDNPDGLVAQGALANARHDFATARDHARAA